MKLMHKYSSFIKIEHSLFSIPLLFAGTYLAGHGWPSLRITLLILLAGAGARIGALCLNRIIDRDIDKDNPRTKDRHLATGTMKLIEAWVLAVLSIGIYVYCAWLISDFCLKLSWVPIFAFGAYPYFKRFTRYSHVGLGLVWALVPLGGFFAVNPSLTGIAPVLMLGLFCVFWLAGFDIIYATMDEEYDRQAGLHSLPASLGSLKALKVASLFHIFAFITLVFLYGIWLSGPLTVMVLFIIGFFLYLEQKFSNYIDFAFFQINVAIGFIVFLFVFFGMRGF